MPRYFLHMRLAERYIADDEGYDLPNLEAAQKEAVMAAREIMSERILDGNVPDESAFEIVDESGNMLAVVAFSSALRNQ